MKIHNGSSTLMANLTQQKHYVIITITWLKLHLGFFSPLSRFYESVKYCLFSGSLLDPLFVQSDTWYHLLSFSESSQTHHVQPSLPLFSVPCLREWHHLSRKPEMWELIHRSIPVPIHFYCYSLMCSPWIECKETCLRCSFSFLEHLFNCDLNGCVLSFLK